MNLSGISMFSSAGIAETYLSELGIDIRLANEIDPIRAQYHSHFYPDAEMVVGDIQDPDVYSEFISKAKSLRPRFLLATPPCQGMSSLGKKQYSDDSRNYLIFSVLNAIEDLVPDIVAIENVPKFFKLLFPYKGQNLPIIDILKLKYNDTYAIEPVLVNAKDYGVPQSRPRALVIMHKPTYSWHLPPAEKEITLREAIGHLPSLKNGENSGIKYHYALTHSAMHIEVMSHTPEGCSAMNNPVFFPRKENGQKVSGFHNTYNRLKWDVPCAAVTTNSGMISGHNNVHPGRKLSNGLYSDPRALSLLEIMIVSSLPCDWNLPKNYNDRTVRTLIGEAIPPLLLKKILSTLQPRTSSPNMLPNPTSRSNKKDKWTIMKYVNKFDLLLKYATLIRNLNAKVDDRTIAEINNIMKGLNIYQPKYGKPSVDTTNFKICQIVYFMFAYRNEKSANKEIVFSPLGNLLLNNLDKTDWIAKIFATMLFGLPFNHPFNKMSPQFDLYPFRLIFQLLLDHRLEQRLYQDELFYLVLWTKEIDDASYNELVDNILELRSLSPKDKYVLFTENLKIEDTLANALHETSYLMGQLESAGIARIIHGNNIGILRQGGFGRGEVPAYPTTQQLEEYNPSGFRMYKNEAIALTDTVKPLLNSLLTTHSPYCKPHELLRTLGRQDYILQLYNFYPDELLQDLGVKIDILQIMLKLSQDINRYSRNQEDGDCYKFESTLANAFNQFIDVHAEYIGGPGNTDVECIYLARDEKFAVEAKSTKTKLAQVNAGRLQLHRNKIMAKYTIVVAPYYKTSTESDIAGTCNVLITASSLANFLYQSAINDKENISYKSLYDIVKSSFGTNITDKVNSFVAKVYGIGKS